MPHPTPRALAICAAGLALSVLPVLVAAPLWAVWAVAWGAFALALLTDAALAVRPADVSVTAELPPSAGVGRPLALPLRLTTPPRRALRLALRLEVSEELDRPDVQTLDTLGGVSDVSVPIRLARRGTARVEAAWLRWQGPLGLVRRTHRCDLDATTRAVPDLGYVRGEAIRVFSDRTFRSGLKVERYLGDGTEFHALRDHFPGDDRRAIDWKASARHTRLLLRQHRAERNHQIILAVDTGRLMAEPLDGLPRLDHAIHAALALGYVATRTGDRVGLFAFDSTARSYVAARAGTRGFQAMLATSSELTYSRDETNFTLGLTELATQLQRRSLIVVLTDFVDSVTAELMVENLNRLARRHLLVFVALRDPLLTDTVRAAPRDLETIHRAVVAGSLLRERGVVLRQLRRAGVFCIDARPGEVGASLLDRYLQIKRRELI